MMMKPPSYLIGAAKDKMAAAARSWTLSVEQQELLIKSCFEGNSVATSLSI